VVISPFVAERVIEYRGAGARPSFASMVTVSSQLGVNALAVPS